VRDPSGTTTTYAGECDADGSLSSDVPLGGAGAYAVSARGSLGSLATTATTGFVVMTK
jgi:hypothetical protein